MKKKMLLVTVVMLTMVVLAGCGPDDAPSPAPVGPTPTPGILLPLSAALKPPPGPGSPDLPGWVSEAEPLARERLVRDGVNADAWFSRANRTINKALESANRPGQGGGASGAKALNTYARMLWRVIQADFILIFIINPCVDDSIISESPGSRWAAQVFCQDGVPPVLVE